MPSLQIYSEVRELIRDRRASFLVGFLLLSINRAAGLVLPGSSQFILDDVVLGGRQNLLVPIAGAVGAAILVQAITSFFVYRVVSIPAFRLITDMRIRVQQHIARLPLRFFDANKTGALVSRIMSDVAGVRNLVGVGMVNFVGSALTAIFAFVMMLRIDPFLSFVALLAIVTFGLVIRKPILTLRPMFRERSRIQAELTGRLVESLGGIRVIKGFHSEARETGVFAAGAERLFVQIRHLMEAQARMQFISTSFLGLVTVGGIVIGGRVLLNGSMSIGEVSAFALYVRLWTSPAVRFVEIGNQVSEAAAGLDRINEVLSERPEDEDPERTQVIDQIEGHIRFEQVSFEYSPGNPVLRDFDFEALPGTVTALVGPSGAGKSTLVSLVAGFAKPSEGRLLVDGVNLSTVTTASYRSQLGVVLQEDFLFDGTLRENILFGRPHASDDEMLSAAQIAHVDEFAERFEQGYETIIGERGVKLSGGQRQRLAIARAILASPRILILDEATSSLDSESEAYVQEGLSALMKGRTVFAIAHRLSTIRGADQIVFLEEGEIRERGSHEELLDRRGRYHDLYTQQSGLLADRFVNPGEISDTPATDQVSVSDDSDMPV